MEVLKSRISPWTDLKILHGWITANTEVFVSLTVFAVWNCFLL